jgi:hypothetical protein
MKRLITCILILISIYSYGQDQPFRRPFAFVGIGYSPTKDAALSAEIGYWGIVSSTSFSITYDVVKNLSSSDNEVSRLIGFKPYFTIFDNKEVSYMVYAMPKFDFNNFDNSVVEFGFNPNYKVGNNGLIAITIGNQLTKNSQWNMFLSSGYIVLF